MTLPAKLEKDINLQIDGDFIKPDDEKFNEQDLELINQMVDVLEHERFDHGGWSNHSFYKFNACKFLLKLVRGEYE